MRRLDGKVTLITGAGTGMGRACMEIFAREGATVVGLGRRQQPLNEVLDAVLAAGGKGAVFSADLSDPAAAQESVDRTVREFGRLDGLVNCAAMGGNSYRQLREGGMNAIAETASEHWHELMRNNLDSVFYMCRAAVPVMKSAGEGSIVNITSISAVQGLPGAHAYAVAKAGIANMSRQMAVSYGRYGIRTNTVCPGGTDTPMMVGSPFMELVRPDNPDRFNHNPMGRAGTPEEMAYGCLFLVSDEASYVNGATIVIDGGQLACPS